MEIQYSSVPEIRQNNTLWVIILLSIITVGSALIFKKYLNNKRKKDESSNLSQS